MTSIADEDSSWIGEDDINDGEGDNECDDDTAKEQQVMFILIKQKNKFVQDTLYKLIF